MDQLLKMAADAGMTKEHGKAASGGIFSLVKKTLDSGDYNKILQKIPEIEGLVSEQSAITKNLPKMQLPVVKAAMESLLLLPCLLLEAAVLVVVPAVLPQSSPRCRAKESTPRSSTPLFPSLRLLSSGNVELISAIFLVSLRLPSVPPKELLLLLLTPPRKRLLRALLQKSWACLEWRPN
jgi:hypothetical protein